MDKCYRFFAPLGLTITSKRRVCSINSFPMKSKAKKIVDSVRNPFLISYVSTTPTQKHISRYAKWYAKFLIWLYRNFYFGLYLISKFHLNIYDNAIEATDVFCRIVGDESQKILCLPRSIFAATTSKRFKKHGAMFVGIFLPSRHMHAWIIEDEYNAWRNDAVWINYTPITIMI